ncbi:NUDIX domain-containing protein [bacterium]|nr:NUDIX domain-containing protein [bacterium]
MEQVDLTFKTGKGNLNIRVGAIIIDDGKLLMVKDTSPYFYSVGGRVRINETSEEAVVREVLEETGLELEIDRLGFIHENLFKEDLTEEQFHEITFFYYMKNRGDVKPKFTSFAEAGVEVSLHWIPLEEVSGTYLYPEFFKTMLDSKSDKIEHVITKQVAAHPFE